MQPNEREPRSGRRDLARGCGLIAAVLCVGLLINFATGCYREHWREYEGGSRSVRGELFEFGLQGPRPPQARSADRGTPFTLHVSVRSPERRPKRLVVESVSLRTASGSKEVGVPGVGALPVTGLFDEPGRGELRASVRFEGVQPPEEDLLLTLRCRIDDEAPLTFEVELPVRIHDRFSHPFLDRLLSV